MQVTLLDMMPSNAFDIQAGGLTGAEERVVLSARVSTNKGLKGAEPDIRLLNYLWKNKHTTPFEQVVVSFQVECDIVTARQWMRHRTQSYNEISRRYTNDGVTFYTPVLRMQSTDNKQGSAGRLHRDEERTLLARIQDHYAQSAMLYQALVEAGVANEVARYVLPMATMTRFVSTANWLNWWKFVQLRNKPDAQEEIRILAEQVEGKLRGMMPHLEL